MVINMNAMGRGVTLALGDVSALPVPLSPDQFSDVTGATLPINPLPNTDSTTVVDRLTLQQTLKMLGPARAQALSSDTKEADAGKLKLAVLIAYLTGYADSRGLLNKAPANPGFESLFGSTATPDLKGSLDELEKCIGVAVAAPDTRVSKATWNAIGDAMISVGGNLVVAGIVGMLAPK
jgi:hypothetical protein